MVALVLLTGPALAHSWYTDLRNEKAEPCCNGVDCFEIPDSDVTAVPGGYQVHTYGMSGEAISGFVPNARAQPAKEGGNYHLCYWGNQIRCFFYPAPSF